MANSSITRSRNFRSRTSVA